MRPQKIISGGQTGADWAALVAAVDLGIPTGGTAPKGWRIQLPNGKDDSEPRLQEFGLREHVSREWRHRTIQNVLDAELTVWVGHENSPGGKLTLSTALNNNRFVLVNPSPQTLAWWVHREQIQVLNVAGNRLSSFNPFIEQKTYSLITHAFHGPNWEQEYQLPWWHQYLEAPAQ